MCVHACVYARIHARTHVSVRACICRCAAQMHLLRHVCANACMNCIQPFIRSYRRTQAARAREIRRESHCGFALVKVTEMQDGLWLSGIMGIVDSCQKIMSGVCDCPQMRGLRVSPLRRGARYKRGVSERGGHVFDYV